MEEVTLTARLRTGFSVNHLLVAVKAARDAHQIELKNVGAAFGPWFDGVLQEVPVAIVMSAAALEANANEIVDDILEGLAKLPVTKSQTKLLRDLSGDKSGSIKEKYRKLALIMGHVPDCGRVIWEEAFLLTTFRNHFMHFRPAWDDDQVHRGNFVNRMRLKVPVVDAYKDNFIFPYGLMTYGCARWAVETALGFSAEFSKLAGINDRFASPHLDTKLL